jgi:zinc transport system ATP-binding protein
MRNPMPHDHHGPSDRTVETRADTLIAGEGLSLAHGAQTVLRNVNVSVRAGEIVTVIGPNGAGKSTLLRILLGLLKPDTGTVRRRDGLRIGYLPQRLPVDPVLPLTVARLMTLTVRRPRDAVEAALAETGVAHLIDAAVQTLSGGELQRVLLGRALLVEPDLLVLDEPVQGVDFAGEAALYELIGGLRRKRGCGILMVSHDLHVVMAAADRVICLNRHVCCAGTAETVGRHPEYIRLFGARAAQALAVYTHHHDHAHTIAGGVVPLGGRGSGGDSRPPASAEDTGA